MSEDYLAQAQPTQTWNTVRGVWEKQGIANLLCEHWELFSETWQTSGTMRNGKVYELPTQAHHITDSEFSSSPTPLFDTPDTMPDLPNSGSNRKNQIAGLGNQAKSFTYAQQEKLMPTPNTMDYLPARTPEQKALNKHKGGYANVRETVVNDLLPTTTASDWKGANHSGSGSASSNGIATAADLLPTPTAVDGNTIAKSELDGNDPKHRLKVAAQVLAREGTQWGKFEPAIRRWEQTLGRPAPQPTKPDGKDGAHRLSSLFTEWMMGLPEGWVTGVGLTRNEELKACGNGVVPQQAELALRVLLEGLTIPSTKNSKLFATPNTMDSLPPRYGEAYEKVKNAGGRKNRDSSGNLREQVVHVLPGNPGGNNDAANSNS